MYPLNIRLTYRHESEACPPVEGWYLPSESVPRWLETLRGLNNQSSLRFLIAPQSLQNQTAAGLICLGDSSTVPLGAIGLCRMQAKCKTQFWLPVHGKIEPEPAAELWLSNQPVGQRTVFVWLPSNGLIRFESEDESSIADFICRPAQNLDAASQQWSPPPDAVSLPDRLVDIRLLQPLTFTQVFEAESEAIGGDEKLLDKLRDDGTASDQTFGERVRNWFTRSFQSMTAGNVQSERDRQIEKLLELMKHDPDKALRYAIPMSGLQTFRGIAQPGSKLTSNSTDFSLARLFSGGGKPADVWNLDAKLRAQLHATYREQANRELALGRHRRAAYIHAHLLGDLTSAAQILEQGQQFDEAAVLYGEKLSRPKDQARCLALAGKDSDAAEIYEKLGEFELAAVVWEAADEQDRARESYEKAANKLIAERQPREAANLILQKLRDHSRAENLLWQQWPSGFSPLECAELGFTWLAERQMHAEAHDRVRWAVSQSGKTHQLLLAKLMASLSQTYPMATLRDEAEDHCRISIAKELQRPDYRQVEPPLAILRSLSANDTLLIRDTRRFQEADRLKQPRLAPPVDRSAKNKLKPLPLVRLPAGYEYSAAQLIGNDLLAFAQGHDDLFMMRSSDCVRSDMEFDRFQVLSQQMLGGVPMSHCCLVLRDRATIYLSFRNEQLTYKPLALNAKGDGLFQWHLLVNPFPSERCGIFSADGTRYSLSADYGTISVNHQGVLASFDLELLCNKAFADLHEDQLDDPVDLDDAIHAVAVHQQAFFVLGRFVISIIRGKPSIEATADANVSCIAASLPHTARRVALATSKSLSVVWLERNNRVETICRDDGYRHVAFLSGGYLIATTDTYLRVFRLVQRTNDVTQLVEERLLQAPDAIAILPMNPEHFGVLYRNGLLERFRIQR